MLVWGKSIHLPSQDSQLHLVASAVITDHTQKFHSADRAEEKRMGGLLSSEQGRERDNINVSFRGMVRLERKTL